MFILIRAELRQRECPDYDEVVREYYNLRAVEEQFKKGEGKHENQLTNNISRS